MAGDGPPVIMLHGFADSADTWRGVLDRLEERGRSGVAVDLLGFGEADAPAPGPTLPQLDRLVAELTTTHAGTGSAILVGNSLGAGLTVRAAQNHAIPLQAVVPMAVPGLGYRPLIRRTMHAKPWLTDAVLRVPMPAGVLRRGTNLIAPSILYGSRSAAEPAVLARFAALSPNSRAVLKLAKSGRAVISELDGSYHFDQVDCPTLVVHGARDQLIPPAAGRAVRAGVAHSELMILPKCGHCPQLDIPVRIADLVLDFAQRQSHTRSHRA